MIALNLADFDLTEGIEHYFRLAVSVILYLGRGLMTVRHGRHCLGLYQSCDITRKWLLGLVVIDAYQAQKLLCELSITSPCEEADQADNHAFPDVRFF
jgi:hypothetical protein